MIYKTLQRNSRKPPYLFVDEHFIFLENALIISVDNLLIQRKFNKDEVPDTIESIVLYSIDTTYVYPS